MTTRIPKTERGRGTRDRIVGGAADLIGRNGVQGTSLDEILALTGASKSQLYHYFSSKEDLARAVVARQTERVLAAQMPQLEHLDSWEAIEGWFDILVSLQERHGCRGGCPIGSLSNELADHDEPARNALIDAFDRWQQYLTRGLAAMQSRGELAEDGDPEALALATMASIQGGLVLARTHRSLRPLRIALNAALAHLQIFDPRSHPRSAG
jgi:TetR/AcrR family transcriptional repressor of nem operon